MPPVEVEISESGDALVAALTFSVPLKIAGQILHKGRSKLYEMAGEGVLDFVKSDGRCEVTVESIRRYQAGLPRNPIKPPTKPNHGLEDLKRLTERRREQRAKRRRGARSATK